MSNIVIPLRSIFGKNVWIVVGMMFLTTATYSQTKPENLRLTIDETINTIEDLFQKINKDLQIEIGYLPNEIDTGRKIQWAPGQYSLKKLLEETFPKSTYQILWKSNKILIKENSKTSKEGKRIYGYVQDAESGEKLLGATIYNKGEQTGVLTNTYGYFSIESASDTTLLSIRYMGYETRELTIVNKGDTLINIPLKSANQLLNNIVVTENRLKDKLESTESGVIQIPIEQIKALPSFIGEVDVIKNIQLLPGVQMVGEGTSAYYVRGGNYDQNLILLDEAPVYNPSHALGFYSVFNGDAIKDLSFYKSHIPVKYGGKLSSVLDIRMKEGNKNKYQVSGGLGLISSRLSVEGPIVKDKASFLLTGRRTYADLLYGAISTEEDAENTSIYFYDFNAKMNYKLGEKDQLFLSGFFGRDVNQIDIQQYGIIWDNQTVTLRWNHIFSNRLFANTSLIYSKYNYNIGLKIAGADLHWKSYIEDLTAKIDFDWYANPIHKLRYGLSTTFHNISPGKVAEPGFEMFDISEADALEHVLYLDDQIRVTDRLNVELGLRMSVFQNMGNSSIYKYDPNYEVADSNYYKKGDIYHTIFAFDPRISASYSLNGNSSLKASYDRTSQFIHLLQNNQIPFSSFDQWLISNPNIKPQYANHLSLGYYHYFNKSGIGLTTDVFYKYLYNQIDAADHAQLLLNKYLEGEVRSGKGESYGFELTLEKSSGKLQGILGYTYLRAKRTINGINNGSPYNAQYDKPHTIQATMVYNASKRIDIGMNWVYSSGGPVTLPSKTFFYEGKSVPVYNGRNQYRMPDYHRLDLSLTLHRKKKEGIKNHSTWVFALYNAYMRKNPSNVFASQKLDANHQDIIDPTQQKIYKSWMFGIVPAITYNFNF